MTALFVVTTALYGIACALFLLYLARGAEGKERWATRTLTLAALAHGAFVLVDGQTGRLAIDSIHQTLSAASLLIVVAYLIARLKYPITVLGAFVTPITLLFLLGAGFGQRVATVPAEVRSALLPVHIAVNLLGVVAFALAFVAALAYVIQEQLLRRKRIGGVFQRLPPLDQLDSLGFRLITLGFPLLTVGIVTGAIWAVRLEPGSFLATPTQAFALVAWLIFALVLLLRLTAGWRGRRAAIGTLVGFGCAAAVLVGYVVR